MGKRRTQRPSSQHGVLTRSRSDIFVHRTRSGLARADPPARRHGHLVSIPPPTSPDRPSPADGAVGRTAVDAIRDLRARRVFTPASISMETSSPEKTVSLVPVADGIEQVDHVEKEAATVDQERRAADEVMDQADGPEEDLLQSTPPDNQNTTEAETVSEGRTAACAPVSNADVVIEPAPTPKSKPALARCSRSRLFRNPSSFSYRRLLPFLKNLEKGETDANQVLSCKDYPVKLDYSVEEKKSLCRLEQFPKDQHMVGDPKCYVPVVPTLDFVEIRNNASPEKNPSSELHNLEVSKTNLCSERQLDFDEFKSEACPDDPILESMLQHSPSSPTTIPEALSEEELAGSVRALSNLPRKPEFNCGIMQPGLVINKKSPPDTSPSRLVHSWERALAIRKGILKNHTRVCKGICLCLDCVEFRIHAERAFEFSRRQMEEADEIIIGLIKEVTGMRNLVQKSLMSSCEGAGTSAHQFNQDLARGACLRASRAEEAANKRRKQLLNDLNIYCRIPGPRVTFAECIEEIKTPRQHQQLNVCQMQI